MIVRHLKDAPNKVIDPNGDFVSNRYLVESDGLGYSVTLTQIKQGLCKPWHYKNHLESCFCIKGYGRIINLETNDIFEIFPGTIYSLNKNEKHQLEVFSERMELICVFNPPLKGNEIHKEDGSY